MIGVQHVTFLTSVIMVCQKKICILLAVPLVQKLVRLCEVLLGIYCNRTICADGVLSTEKRAFIVIYEDNSHKL